ncbi:MAG: AtpZ/AtpI family protein [Saprospiraceae bacterium]
MKYSGMAFQMGAIILAGTLLGKKLDSYLAAEIPYLTIVFALLSIFAALYISLKDLIKKN